MKVAFKYVENGGFQTDDSEKIKITLKNSIANNTENYSPTEHLLLAMGGCSSDDVVNILRKMKVDFKEFRCEVTAQRADEHPKTLTYVNIHYFLDGDLDPDKARKAINLSLTKYCSVSIIVKRGGADLRYSLTVNGHDLDNEKTPEEALASPA
jgi:putative redox protein